jgi:pyridoxamine 5'-phosphate oxidase family protein
MKFDMRQETNFTGFTESESSFLKSQLLGRVATVSLDTQPHVVPVGYRFDGQNIYFTGHRLTDTLKFRNLAHNNRVAFVVDDLVSTDPWRPRGIEVRGFTETFEENGKTWVKIKPVTKVSWGL